MTSLASFEKEEAQANTFQLLEEETFVVEIFLLSSIAKFLQMHELQNRSLVPSKEGT